MAQTISTNSPHLAPDTIRTPARPPLQGMLFFPPPSPSTADLAVDGLLLSGALMPRPSVLEQQQRNQQLQRQLFLMEQQLQQQPFPLGALLPPAAPLGDTSPAGLALTIPSFPVDTSTPFSSSSSSGQPVPAPPGPLPNPQSQVSLLPALPPTGPCSACQQPIAEKSFLLVDGRCWHPECVRCAICGQNLEREGSSCFVRDGFLFCARDYFQKFGKRCERCGVGIERGEMVMRVPRCDSAELALFHLHCFSCVCCGHLLSPGQQYTVAPASHPGGPLFCTAHFHLNPFTHLPPPGMGADSERQGQRFLAEMVPPQAPSKVLEQLVPPPHASSTAPQNNCVSPNASQQMLTLIEANSEISPDSYRQLRGPLSAETPNGRQNGEEDGHEGRDESVCSNGADSQANGRQKRMRTSFKHHQLRTMKTYFGLNHNPDAKDLKQLAQKTGLTKRVLQVWFQNARAKYRRNQQHRGGMLDAHVQMQMIGQPVLNTNTNGGSGHSLSAAGFAPRSLMGDQMAVVGPTGSSAIVVPVPKAASISPMGSSLGGFESVNGSTADEQSSDNDAPQRGANYQ